MAKSKSPLTDADLPNLNKLIRDCEETLQLCAKCEACNLDLTPEREKTTDQLDTARKLKAAFFPTAK
jgi:hypothetical protein